MERNSRTSAIALWVIWVAMSLRQAAHALSVPPSVPSSPSTTRARNSGCSLTTATSLDMAPLTPIFHMGHSHSHHHHHGFDDPSSSTTTSSSNASSVVPPLQQGLRKAFWLMGCAILTLGVIPRVLLHQRGLQSRDWLALLMSWMAALSAGSIQRAFQSNFRKTKALLSAIVQHSVQPGEGEISELATAGTNPLLGRVRRRRAVSATAEADRVTWMGVVVNLLLSIGKLVVGVTQHSNALVADAGHSLSDLVSDFITLWSVRIARLPPDEDHPYGHWKFEAIGSLFLSLTLIATGLSVGTMSQKQLWPLLFPSAAETAAADASMIPLPGPLALVMAGLSIASKEWLYRITKAVGVKLNSPVVVANAHHHRSDAYSSVLALLSIAWARAGFIVADAAAGLLVAGMIASMGGEILLESLQQLTDSSHKGLSRDLHGVTQTFVDNDDDVLGLDSLKARRVGSSAAVEILLETSPDLSTTATLAVEERLKKHLDRYWKKEGDSEETPPLLVTVHAKTRLVVCPLLEATTTAVENSSFVDSSLQSQEHDHEHHHAHFTESATNAFPETASEDESHNHYHEHDHHRDYHQTNAEEEVGPSASRLEFLIRQKALFLELKSHHAPYTVGSVTIHYLTPLTVRADVTIRGHDATADLDGLRASAESLRSTVTRISGVQEAGVFLDLLADDSDPFPTPPSELLPTRTNPKSTNTTTSQVVRP